MAPGAALLWGSPLQVQNWEQNDALIISSILNSSPTSLSNQQQSCFSAGCSAEDLKLLPPQLQLKLQLPALVPNNWIVLGLADPTPVPGSHNPFHACCHHPYRLLSQAPATGRFVKCFGVCSQAGDSLSKVWPVWVFESAG